MHIGQSHRAGAEEYRLLDVGPQSPSLCDDDAEQRRDAHLWRAARAACRQRSRGSFILLSRCFLRCYAAAIGNWARAAGVCPLLFGGGEVGCSAARMLLPASRDSCAACAPRHGSQPQGPRRALFTALNLLPLSRVRQHHAPHPQHAHTHPDECTHTSSEPIQIPPNSYSHPATMREVISLNGTSRYAPTRLDRL